MAAAQRRDSQGCRRGWSSWRSAVAAEPGGCMFAAAGHAAARSLGKADIAAVEVDTAEAVVVVAGNVAGSSVEAAPVPASGPLAGDPAAVAAAGFDSDGTDPQAVVEEEGTEDMAAAAAAAEKEGEEEEAGNTALPELDSASQSWTLFLQLLKSSFFKDNQVRLSDSLEPRVLYSWSVEIHDCGEIQQRHDPSFSGESLTRSR